MAPAPLSKKKDKNKGHLFRLMAILFAVPVLAALAAMLMFGGGGRDVAVVQQETYLQTAVASEAFGEASLFMSNLLENGKDMPDEQLAADMVKLEGLWARAAAEADRLGDLAEELVDVAEDEAGGSSALIPAARAMTQQEWMNAVYDAAPAGKRIQTLARLLGTDAKTAWRMLKANNEEISKTETATADTYEKLENTARVVKDVSKVTLYVAGSAVTGGSSSVLMTALGQAELIVGGADLLLEISEDAAYITMGYNSDVAAHITSIRRISEPIASTISLINLGGNAAELATDAAAALTKQGSLLGEGNKMGLITAAFFTTDQIRSKIQDGKILGIEMNRAGELLETDLTAADIRDYVLGKKIGEKPGDPMEILGELEGKIDEARDQVGLPETPDEDMPGAVEDDGDEEVTAEVPPVEEVVEPAYDIPAPPVKASTGIKTRNFTPLKTWSVKDDYCGVGIPATYCKCAFHGQYCDSLEMEPGDAGALVYGGFETWKQQQFDRVKSNCTKTGGRWSAGGCEKPPICNDGYVLEGFDCVDISRYCGRDPYVTYNPKTDVCGCVSGFQASGAGARTVCKYIIEETDEDEDGCGGNCAAPPSNSKCGDGICSSGETCPADCG